MGKNITVGTLGHIFLWSICCCLLLFVPSAGNTATYSESAHGDPGYGVLRSSMPSTYAQGNCGHCHEQHEAAKSGLLFATNFSGKMTNPYTAADNACFQCHQDASSQSGGITNNNYSATFGGATAESDSIMDAFNQSSYHNLYDIQQYITGSRGTKSFSNFSALYNPCSGCHNAHLAKANKRSTGDPTETVMSKPSDHENLWGDDNGTTELMTSYGTGYQPPLYDGSTTLLEPDGLSTSATTQAGKTPNYNAFCTDCHNSTNVIYSTELGRNLRTFDWSQEVHGEDTASDDSSWSAEMRSPYSDSNLGSYVLSCMDCHEPHGSSNAYLIRTSINAGSVSLPSGSSNWDNVCSRCHAAVDDLRSLHHRVKDDGDYSCSDCHIGSTRGGDMVSCIECHYHGASFRTLKTF